MNKGFAIRLKEFRKSLGPKVTQTDLAEMIGGGIDFTNVTSWERGHIPDGGNMNLLLNAFPNLNKNWLLTGEGDMFISKPAIKTDNSDTSLLLRLVNILEKSEERTDKLLMNNELVIKNNDKVTSALAEISIALIEKIKEKL